MQNWTSLAPTVLASFMASMVEFVEALTIVLAVGVVRGWRSALLGTVASLLVLVALIAVLGPSLTRIPLPLVQLVVGGLLLLFGLRWLRKAVLRAAGVLALHDEADAFAKETEALRGQGGRQGVALDKVAFLTSFKIVMLEGIEVVFIVIAIGASGNLIVPASVGALLALLVVAALGFWLRKPLANVPENALKFGVGVMLSAFGTFWVGEGVGIEWPGADWALLAMISAYLAFALFLVGVCRRVHGSWVISGAATTASASPTPPSKSALMAVLDELVGLFIDDGWLAAGVVLWIALAWLVERNSSIASPSAAVLFVVGLSAVLGLSAARRAAIQVRMQKP